MLIGLVERLECENEKLGWQLCSWTALSWGAGMGQPNNTKLQYLIRAEVPSALPYLTESGKVPT